MPTLAGRLERLREEFDGHFAAPPPPPPADMEDLLAIDVGGDPYAVRLGSVAALVVDRPPTRLPQPTPGLLGVAGVRGTVVPVYDLAPLLGLPGSAAAPRLLLVLAGEPLLGLAVARLDGHLRVARDGTAHRPGATAFVAGVVQTPTGARPLLDLDAVRAAIVARTGPGDPDRNG